MSDDTRTARYSHLLAGVGLALAMTAGTAIGAELPGAGIKMIPAKSSIAEENFQTKIVMKGLERLGYDVQPIVELDIPTVHLAVANGDATFFPVHWDPLHNDFYEHSGGDAKLWRDNALVENSLQGYLIDKKTADEYGIHNIEQLKDPKLAALFDTDGDGKANLTGCNPGWGCERIIEHQLDAYGLRGSINHDQGNYTALMADTMTRYKQGKPIFYYTWTPFWISNVLKPGQDVVFLEVPFSSQPEDQKQQNTQLPNGKDYGWLVNTTRIVVNRDFLEKNPAAKKFFEEVKIPIADINAQNRAMADGADTPADIEKHVNGWIKAHEKEFDQWVNDALAAAK
ncbi:glycine betaine/L-proline ABC transporter substrate-binding protein ProX [Castellaniella sp.]|uniref:glycine betaine/L-proline ABC transporter substrate-binding protein ProX n=1 Tax=Castellaniella sp. TaxID=1955812 RepID=UPI00356667A3